MQGHKPQQKWLYLSHDNKLVVDHNHEQGQGGHQVPGVGERLPRKKSGDYATHKFEKKIRAIFFSSFIFTFILFN